MTAITSPKMAITTISTKNSTIRNRTRARGEIIRPAMSPIDWPRDRSDTTRAPKSCTAPMNMEPSNTHNSAGSQPQNIAMAGPTIGPVPAIDVK